MFDTKRTLRLGVTKNKRQLNSDQLRTTIGGSSTKYLMDYPNFFFVPWSPGNVPQALDCLRNEIGALVSLSFIRSSITTSTHAIHPLYYSLLFFGTVSRAARGASEQICQERWIRVLTSSAQGLWMQSGRMALREKA